MVNKKLVPLKFNPIFKEKIWGGNKISTFLSKDFFPLENCGETWEISTVRDNVSIVSEGIFANEPLDSLINQYKEALLGKNVYNNFKNEFPLLIKFIDANKDLSIQVHPNDEVAKSRHNSFGKTEMWYILQADENSKINVGFNTEITKEEYLEHLRNKSLEKVLNFENVKQGDVYYLPAGRIHYIGKGCLIAEIQQTSDLTYRIYDFDRVDKHGNKRELHTELALDCIDFSTLDNYKTEYNLSLNQESKLVHSPYFKTNILLINGHIVRNYENIDSFIVYVVVEGNITIEYNNEYFEGNLGECILIPACIKELNIKSEQNSKVIEVWVD